MISDLIEELKSFLKEKDAVSPVIGVILMVAITVILAAVIGAFVLGIGGEMAQTPNANLAVDEDSNYDDTSTSKQDVFSVDHNGGDSLQTEDIRLIIRDDTGDRIVVLNNINSDSDDTSHTSTVSVSYGQDTFGVGDRINIEVELHDNSGDGNADDPELNNGDEITIQLIHKPSDGVVAERTITLTS